MKVGMFIGKVKKFGIGWCIHHRMAADNAEGGSGQTPPTVLCIAVKVAVFYEIDSKLWLFWLPYASLCLGNYLDQFFEKFLVDWWPFYLTEPDESPLVEEKVKKTPFLSLVK